MQVVLEDSCSPPWKWHVVLKRVTVFLYACTHPIRYGRILRGALFAAASVAPVDVAATPAPLLCAAWGVWEYFCKISFFQWKVYRLGRNMSHLNKSMRCNHYLTAPVHVVNQHKSGADITPPAPFTSAEASVSCLWLRSWCPLSLKMHRRSLMEAIQGFF